MHHYRNDETDVFLNQGVPTTSFSQKPHIVIDTATGVQWINLGGVGPGAAATFYRSAGVAAGNFESVTGSTRVITAADDGMIFGLARAAGIAFTFTGTLPTGFRVGFVVQTAPTTICTITAPTADTISGWPINVGGADSSADGNAAGDVLNFAANTALPSDRADMLYDGTTWHVRATAKVINAITITG